MSLPQVTFSEDQAAAWDTIAVSLRQAGGELDDGLLDFNFDDDE